MPEFFDSPDFALTAITLRGVGSYRTGQRLEIKPLTIICGPNGSGKSTWLKALAVLREALDLDLLPFQFGPSAENLTNACYYNFEVGEDGKYIAEAEVDHEFGPPGTIGIEFVATRDVERDDGDGEKWHDRNDYGEFRRCRWHDSRIYEKGTLFRLRIAHPRFNNATLSPRHLVDFVELAINGVVTARLVGTIDPFQKGEFRNLPLSFFLATDSPAFTNREPVQEKRLRLAIEYNRGFDEEKRIETLDPLLDRTTLFGTERLLHKTVIECFRDEIRRMARIVLDGCFSIGALRDIETSTNSKENRDRLRKSSDSDYRWRYVGNRGEHAWAVLGLPAIGSSRILLPRLGSVVR